MWAVKQVDELRRNFLWRSKPDANSGMALVNWATVCRPRDLGGLEVLDLLRFGHALRLRWKWLDMSLWMTDERPWIGSPTPCESLMLRMSLFSGL